MAVIYMGPTGGLSAADKQTAAANMLEGTSILHGRVQGTIPKRAAATITPGATSQTIAAGQHLAGDQTIMGEPNLAAENIKAGVTLFGVTGNVALAKHITQSCSLSVNSGPKNGANTQTLTVSTKGYSLLIVRGYGSTPSGSGSYVSVCGSVVAGQERACTCYVAIDVSGVDSYNISGYATSNTSTAGATCSITQYTLWA